MNTLRRSLTRYSVLIVLAMTLNSTGKARDREHNRIIESNPIGSDSPIIFEDIAPSGGFVKAFAFHPTDPDIIYAGLDDSGGLYVSHDGGVTWQDVYLGRQNLDSWDVQLEPGNPDVIYIGESYGHGVLRSEDGGALAHAQSERDHLALHRLVGVAQGVAIAHAHQVPDGGPGTLEAIPQPLEGLDDRSPIELAPRLEQRLEIAESAGELAQDLADRRLDVLGSNAVPGRQACAFRQRPRRLEQRILGRFVHDGPLSARKLSLPQNRNVQASFTSGSVRSASK